MKGKFWGSILLIAALVFVAACGSQGNNEAGNKPSSGSSSSPGKKVETLTLLVHSAWVQPGYQAVIDLVNEKADQLGARIELEKLAEGDAGDQVVYTKFASGEYPDILAFYDATYANRLGGVSKFEDLSGDWTGHYGQGLETPKYKNDGKLITAPFGGVEMLVMFYNKKVFEANNIQVPGTWEELLQASEQLKANGVTPVYYSGKDAWTLQIIPTVGAIRDSKENVENVAEMLSTNKKKFTDLKLFVDAIAKLDELREKGYINDTYLSDDYVSAQQALLDGKAAMYPMGSYVLPDLVKGSAEKANDIGAFGIPFDEGALVQISGPSGLLVPSESPNRELAKKIVQFMVSPEAMNVYFKAQPGIPFIQGLNVENLLPAQQDMHKLIEGGNTYMNPLDFTKYQKGPFERYLQDVLVETITPEEGAGMLDKDFAQAAKAADDPNWK